MEKLVDHVDANANALLSHLERDIEPMQSLLRKIGDLKNLSS